MEKITVICPNCRRLLSFPPVAGYQDKMLECPSCHFKAKVNVYQAGTSAKGGHGDDDPTVLPGAKRACADPGSLRVSATGETFALKTGTNIIGRIAQSGTADLKISTDPYMSRQHLRIDVVSGATGMEHRLVEMGSKNVIQLNGSPIGRGDVLRLHFGDRLLLGQTEVVLEETDEETTQTADLR